jgi:ArsR family transcriptional regulator
MEVVPMKDVAGFFKALSDEARVRIVWLLQNHRELCVCDVMAALGITQSKASRHLIALRHAGLVTDRREGTWSHYALVRPAGGLERAVLDAMRRSLGDHTGAAQALEGLRAWLSAKERGAACASGPRGKGSCR